MRTVRRITLACAAILVASIGAPVAPAHAGNPARSPAHRASATAEQIEYQRVNTQSQWAAGAGQGTVVLPGDGRAGGITMGTPAGTVKLTDKYINSSKTWDYSTWTGPEHHLAFGATEAVASWNADVPAGTWIQIELHGTYTDGISTPWYVMGRWARGDGDILRSSVDHQGDKRSSIYTDTFAVNDPSTGILLTAYQLRITLYRIPGQTVSPRVWELGAMASDIPDRFAVPASAGHIAWGVELAVPPFSQDIHIGQYPQYDGGGEAWCSPTSTQMILDYYGLHPSAADNAWVDPSYADPDVDTAARGTYDSVYQGTGNWPFNTAYAAAYGADAIVTRLHSLDDVERFIAAGIPVAVSVSFLSSELDGAGYSTAGHLFVIVGFTSAGDVVVNDPASGSDTTVRHVYSRTQVETVWLRTERYLSSGSIAGGSGGIAYLIKPTSMAWPTAPDQTW